MAESQGNVVLIKGDTAPSWYISNGIVKRYVSSTDQAAWLVAVFGVAALPGPSPVVGPQAHVNAITTV